MPQPRPLSAPAGKKRPYQRRAKKTAHSRAAAEAEAEAATEAATEAAGEGGDGVMGSRGHESLDA